MISANAEKNLLRTHHRNLDPATQYDLRITHAATALRNLDAATKMRSATADSRTL